MGQDDGELDAQGEEDGLRKGGGGEKGDLEEAVAHDGCKEWCGVAGLANAGVTVRGGQRGEGGLYREGGEGEGLGVAQLPDLRAHTPRHRETQALEP